MENIAYFRNGNFFHIFVTLWSMNKEIKILSAFFLLVYLSFLSHDLIAHKHHHENAHKGHHHLQEDSAASGLMNILWHDCRHLIDDCSECKNDQDLHKQIIFTKDFKSDQDAFIPSKKIRLNQFDPEPTKFYIARDFRLDSYSASGTPLRGPPQISQCKQRFHPISTSGSLFR